MYIKREIKYSLTIIFQGGKQFSNLRSLVFYIGYFEDEI